MPKPTSLIMTGTSTVSTIALTFSIHVENVRFPSGITSSCGALTWICKACASNIRTDSTAFSTGTSAPTLLKMTPSGFTSRTTLKDGAISGLRKAACVEPTAIAKPVSRATLASFSLICFVHSLPPVIALIYKGEESLKSPKCVAKSTSSTSIDGIEWCTNRILSKSDTGWSCCAIAISTCSFLRCSLFKSLIIALLSLSLS